MLAKITVNQHEPPSWICQEIFHHHAKFLIRSIIVKLYKNWTLIKLLLFHDKIFPVNRHQVCSWLVAYTMFLPEVLYGCVVEGWEEFDFREEEPEWLRLCLSKLRRNERGLQRRFPSPTWVLTWDGLRLSLWFWALDSYSSADVFL